MDMVHLNVEFDNLLTNVANAVAVFRHIQRFVLDPFSIDRRFNLSIRLSGSLSLSLLGVYLGTEWKLENEELSKLLSGLPLTPSSKSVQRVTWLQSLSILSGSGALKITPTTNLWKQDNFFAKSVTTRIPLSEEVLTCYFQYIKTKGPTSPAAWDAIINLYGGVDSQINAFDSDFSAYPERNTLWVAQHYSYVPSNDTFPVEGLTFVSGLNEALTKYLPQYGACVNYVDASLSLEEAHDLYYGKELYSRLKKIKDKLDPNNIFANPQSIGRGLATE